METLEKAVSSAEAQSLLKLLQALPIPKERTEELAQAIIAYAGEPLLQVTKHFQRFAWYNFGVV